MGPADFAARCGRGASDQSCHHDRRPLTDGLYRPFDRSDHPSGCFGSDGISCYVHHSGTSDFHGDEIGILNRTQDWSGKPIQLKSPRPPSTATVVPVT